MGGLANHTILILVPTFKPIVVLNIWWHDQVLCVLNQMDVPLGDHLLLELVLHKRWIVHECIVAHVYVCYGFPDNPTKQYKK